MNAAAPVVIDPDERIRMLEARLIAIAVEGEASKAGIDPAAVSVKGVLVDAEGYVRGALEAVRDAIG